METVLKRCGRFTLIRTEQGLCWRLTTHSGAHWHWHARNQQWNVDYQGCPSEEEATMGLAEALDRESAGELDQWHQAPPTHHGTRDG
jgi:hypothetical protein